MIGSPLNAVFIKMVERLYFPLHVSKKISANHFMPCQYAVWFGMPSDNNIKI